MPLGYIWQCYQLLWMVWSHLPCHCVECHHWRRWCTVWFGEDWWQCWLLCWCFWIPVVCWCGTPIVGWSYWLLLVGLLVECQCGRWTPLSFWQDYCGGRKRGHWVCALRPGTMVGRDMNKSLKLDFALFKKMQRYRVPSFCQSCSLVPVSWWWEPFLSMLRRFYCSIGTHLAMCQYMLPSILLVQVASSLWLSRCGCISCCCDCGQLGGSRGSGSRRPCCKASPFGVCYLFYHCFLCSCRVCLGWHLCCPVLRCSSLSWVLQRRPSTKEERRK